MINSFTELEVRKFWNSISTQYEQDNENLHYTHHQRYFEAVKYVPEKERIKILNFWCRLGFLIDYIKEINDEAVIINGEIAELLLEKAKRQYENGLFYHGGFHAFPFKSNTFDLVISLETLEHVPRPVTFLTEIRRILKQNGKLVMSLPPRLAEITTPVSNLLHHGEGPHKFLSSRNVKKLLSRTGFELLEHKGTLIIPFGVPVLKQVNSFLEKYFQNTIISEFGIRQFYYCYKK